jgi:uncharacterized protein
VSSATPVASQAGHRAAWLKTLHQWHWISSALCLIGMLLFSITGITLNHAADIGAKPVVTQHKVELPGALGASLKPADDEDERKAALPEPLRAWLSQALDLKLDAREAEWSPEEIYLSLPRPGGDAWLRIMRDTGEVEYELTERGWISYLNDLHKGRNTGLAWSWFIDIFAAACLVFSITGLLILKMHALKRPSTWPMVGLGLLVPLLLTLLFIH